MFPNLFSPAAAAGGMPSLTNGAGSPISTSTSSATGDQTQNLSFQGGNVNLGGNNNQMLLLGGLMLLTFILISKKGR
ncbi:hypothetical protein [Pseudoalteromonas xiamenensis]